MVICALFQREKGWYLVGGMAVGSRKKPTLKTISELSGLAVPTVSRALHDAPDIGAATKVRVRQIAEEIGYVPNRAGVRLKTGKTNVISLIISTEHEILNHTARMISAIARGLRGSRYHLVITPYFPDEDAMRPVRYVVETESADAIILNQIEPRDPRVRYLLDEGFPFAAHGRSDWRDQHAYFDFDNTEFGRLAARRLVQQGRRHIAVVAPPGHQNYSQDLCNGIREVAQDAGVCCHVLENATSDDASAAITQATREYFEAHREADGLICASTTAAMAAVAGLEAMGKTIGQEVDVAAKEPVEFLKLFRPALHSISEDIRRAGDFLARAAMHAIDAPDEPPMQDLDVPRNR